MCLIYKKRVLDYIAETKNEIAPKDKPTVDAQTVLDWIYEEVNKMHEDIVRCRYCKFSKSTGGDQDGYICTNVRNNSMYERFSLSYCSYGKEKEGL